MGEEIGENLETWEGAHMNAQNLRTARKASETYQGTIGAGAR
jgi:hypothetical protein